MSTLARRALLLAAAAPVLAVASASAQTTEDCDPRRRGTFRYLRCRREYPRRIAEAEERLRLAEVRVESAIHARGRLEGEIAVLEQTLASLQAETQTLETECRALETNLRTARVTSRRNVETYVSRIQMLLEGIDRGAQWALAYEPPNELSWVGRGRYRVQRLALEDGKAEIAAMHREAAAIWAQFAAGYIAGETAERLIQSLLRRIGARVLNPLVAIVATMFDVYDICVALYDTYQVYN